MQKEPHREAAFREPKTVPGIQARPEAVQCRIREGPRSAAPDVPHAIGGRCSRRVAVFKAGGTEAFPLRGDGASRGSGVPWRQCPERRSRHGEARDLSVKRFFERDHVCAAADGGNDSGSSLGGGRGGYVRQRGEGAKPL